MAATREASNDVEGMMHWQRAGALRSALRAIKSSPNDGTVASQTEALKPKFDEPVRNSLYYLLLNFMKVVLGEDRNAWDYFTGNLAYASTQVGKGGAADIRSWAKQIWDQHAFLQATTQRASTGAKQPTKEQAKEKIATPQLDAAIDLVDGLSNMGLPSSVKSSLKGVKSALELARASKQKQESNAVYLKHIAELGSAMFETIGEVVTSAGQDVELAGRAASQLGKIAKLLGGMGKVLTAVTAIQKIIWGKDRGERIDAAIDLITTFGGTVGIAAGISLNAFKWIWNTIGVPVKTLTEEVGLTAVFDGKSPDALKAEFDTLAASEPKVARWAIGKMRYQVFKPRSSPFAPNWNTRDAWERVLRNNSMLNIDVRVADALKRGYTPGSDPVVDDLVVDIKDRYRKLAHQFIDSVVSEAKSWK
jgi:hypothetical protein